LNPRTESATVVPRGPRGVREKRPEFARLGCVAAAIAGRPNPGDPG
jgi:hypothetical protein